MNGAIVCSQHSDGSVGGEVCGGWVELGPACLGEGRGDEEVAVLQGYVLLPDPLSVDRQWDTMLDERSLYGAQLDDAEWNASFYSVDDRFWKRR